MLIWGSPPDKKKTGVARIYYVYTFWSFKPPNHKKYQKSKLSLPSLLYFWKAEGPQWEFKDVKYDIPMCQFHSTRPHNGKKGSLCHHFWRNFWKWGPQKLLPQAYFYVAVKKRIPSINESRSRRATPGHTSTTQKMPQNNIIYRKWPEMAESALWKTVETTYLPPKLTNKWGRKTSTFHIERPVQIWPLEVEIPVRAIFPLYL